MNLAERFITRGTIQAAERISRRTHRIRIGCRPLDRAPGQQIRVHTGGLLSPRRTYTVWEHDGSSLELRVWEHVGDGPGIRWARSVRVGDDALFGPPEGRFVPRSGAYHLFAGEETASVAFGPMLRALPEPATVYGVVEVDEPDDRLRWQYRHGAPAASAQSLVRAVQRLDLPDESGVAYLAGEARTVQAIALHLVRERGWPRRAISTRPFWTPGKKGME